jgi:hypothetical protein
LIGWIAPWIHLSLKTGRFFCEYQQNRYGFVDLAKMARLSLKIKKMRNFEIKDL